MVFIVATFMHFSKQTLSVQLKLANGRETKQSWKVIQVQSQDNLTFKTEQKQVDKLYRRMKQMSYFQEDGGMTKGKLQTSTRLRQT